MKTKIVRSYKIEKEEVERLYKKAEMIICKARAEKIAVDTKELENIFNKDADPRKKVYILKAILFHGENARDAAIELRNMIWLGKITLEAIEDIFRGEEKYRTNNFSYGYLMHIIEEEFHEDEVEFIYS